MSGGALFVISAPSGCGKSTLIERLREGLDGLGFSVSHTTRAPRGEERDGEAYHFVSRERFEEMIADGSFAEWAEVHGNYYGTSLCSVEAARESGDVILDIDVQGAIQLKEKISDATLIFILPPSWDELGRRLRSRGLDSEDVISRRLNNAQGEVEKASHYEYVLINDDIDRAVEELKAIFIAGRNRSSAVERTRALLENAG